MPSHTSGPRCRPALSLISDSCKSPENWPPAGMTRRGFSKQRASHEPATRCMIWQASCAPGRSWFWTMLGRRTRALKRALWSPALFECQPCVSHARDRRKPHSAKLMPPMPATPRPFACSLTTPRYADTISRSRTDSAACSCHNAPRSAASSSEGCAPLSLFPPTAASVEATHTSADSASDHDRSVLGHRSRRTRQKSILPDTHERHSGSCKTAGL